MARNGNATHSADTATPSVPLADLVRSAMAQVAHVGEAAMAVERLALERPAVTAPPVSAADLRTSAGDVAQVASGLAAMATSATGEARKAAEEAAAVAELAADRLARMAQWAEALASVPVARTTPEAPPLLTAFAAAYGKAAGAAPAATPAPAPSATTGKRSRYSDVPTITPEGLASFAEWVAMHGTGRQPILQAVLAYQQAHGRAITASDPEYAPLAKAWGGDADSLPKAVGKAVQLLNGSRAIQIRPNMQRA